MGLVNLVTEPTSKYRTVVQQSKSYNSLCTKFRRVRVLWNVSPDSWLCEMETGVDRNRMCGPSKWGTVRSLIRMCWHHMYPEPSVQTFMFRNMNVCTLGSGYSKHVQTFMGTHKSSYVYSYVCVKAPCLDDNPLHWLHISGFAILSHLSSQYLQCLCLPVLVTVWNHTKIVSWSFPMRFLWSTVWWSLLILKMRWSEAGTVLNYWSSRLWNHNSSPPPSPNPHYSELGKPSNRLSI